MSSYERGVVAKKKVNRKSVGCFSKMGLVPDLLKAIKYMGYRLPTPIQRKCIPIILDGHDVVAMARTGSGKSAAFLIPIIANLKEHSIKIGTRALILSPTRELALQTHRFAVSLSKYTDLRICVIVGGESVEEQFNGLSLNPDLIIATPGRISYLLKEIPKLNLSKVTIAVFDEADRLFEMGFAVQLKTILNRLSHSHKRQTLLFSATMPQNIADFSRAALTNPLIVRLDTDVKISPNLQLSYFYCRENDKLPVLIYLLQRLMNENHLILIFAATRYHVEMICELLRSNDISSVPCYGTMEQKFRNDNIGKFRKKKVNIMVVTDLASRGLDIPLLDFVINFQIPSTPKTFVHRVGRVARAGKYGTAFSIVQHDELPYIVDIYNFLGHALPLFGGSNHSNNANNKTIIQNRNDNDNNNNNDSDNDSDADNDPLNENVEIDDNGMITIEQRECDEDMQLFKSVVDNSKDVEKNLNTPKDILLQEKVTFGAIPRNELITLIESVNSKFQKNDELTKMLETCGKAMRLYNKTKNKASKRSLVEFKKVDIRRIHPIFEIGKKEKKHYSMLDSISCFKPHSTIFELGGAANENYSMMQSKRVNFSNSPKKRKKKSQKIEKKKESVINKYKDKDFYINDGVDDKNQMFVDEMMMVTQEKGDDLKKFIMELDDYETMAINKKKKLYRYNPNKRKFVTEYMGDRINRFMNEKNESNKYVNASNHKYGKLYEAWKEKSKREIGVNGEEQPIDSNRNGKKLGLRRHRHIKGSNEYYDKMRVNKRLKTMRNERSLKTKSKGDKIQKMKREKFRKWWTNNKDQVKSRKAKRRIRPF